MVNTGDEAKARIDWLVKEIDRHDRLYYVEARPVIGDRDYDLLYNELLELEAKYPQFLNPDSPTQRVSGAPVEGFEQVRHDPPMQSLDKTHSRGELADFDAMVRKEADGFTYLVEPKVDGVSISLRYESRRLVRAATRGNGTVGDDVTSNVRTIRAVPLQLPPDAPDPLEVRGEVYMTRDGFVKLNEREETAGREPFANPRNACAGSLKQLDSKVTAERPLDIVIYNAGGAGCGGFASHSEMIEAFRRWGFPVTPWSKSCQTMDEVFAAIDELEGLRHSFKFEIDGAVVKIDERKFYSVLGATAHGPRWARAYKYAPERAETIVHEITVQVGRTGVLTPVAELLPVALSGSVICRATLHNAEDVARQDIREGDHVWLVKAGDVIPAIESPITEKRTGAEKVFQMPTRCPVCGTPTVKLENEVATRCPNPECPAQRLYRITYFCSRNALNIKGVGENIVAQLIDDGKIRDPLDLFDVERDYLAAKFSEDSEVRSKKTGEKKLVIGLGTKLYNSIQDARKRPLNQWINALGLSNIGETTAALIANEHRRFSELPESAALLRVLENDTKKGSERQILPIKVEAAKSVLAFFRSDYGQRVVAHMRALGLDPESERVEVATSGPLVGAGCVITGTLSKDRKVFKQLIQQAGGIMQSSVTGKTKYLIVGDNERDGSSKLTAAKKLGTTIIDEAQLVSMLRETGSEIDF